MSPEELRQQIADLVERYECGDFDDAYPAHPHTCFAAAVIALPAIRRALARDALVQAHFDAPFPRGLGGAEYCDYEDEREQTLISALRALGDQT